MAKRGRKRKRPDPDPEDTASPEVRETDEGVAVIYPGRTLPPPLSPRRRLRHCPSCGEGPVSYKQRYATSSTAYLFECPSCIDPETARPTRWADPRG